MNKFKPIIGITSAYCYDKNISSINTNYSKAIISSGGLPIILPITNNKKILNELLIKCNGLLFTGGPDLDAVHYNENNLEYSGEISPIRDFEELYLAKKCLKINKPILGICRGIQVINIAAKGNIYQDIYKELPNKILIKHYQTAPKWYATHDIFIQKQSKLFECFLLESIKVNSFHHQSIKDVAPFFNITAIAPDGIIEAIEHTSHVFAVGVQWHIEHMYKKDASSLSLFQLFIEKCKFTRN